MTAATTSMRSGVSKTTSTSLRERFSTEKRPPVFMKRRDERIRSFHSFDDITESEEEDIQEPTSSSSSETSERSPYAAYDTKEVPMFTLAKARSFSLTNNPFLSPKSLRCFAPSGVRLSRGFSDPMLRRKSSLPAVIREDSPELDDGLALPPIPEATTPSAIEQNNNIGK